MNVECFVVFHHNAKCGKRNSNLWENSTTLNIVNIKHLLLNWNTENVLTFPYIATAQCSAFFHPKL